MSEFPENPVNNRGITAIIVKGYKAIADEINVEIVPLTIFAGANSSGKSSVMQPLLLMKQTLQATYDPGALLLNGPHVKFTSAKQLFNKSSNGQVNEFDIGIEINKDAKLICTFTQLDEKPIDLKMIELGKTDLFQFIITKGRDVIHDEQTANKIIKNITDNSDYSIEKILLPLPDTIGKNMYTFNLHTSNKLFPIENFEDHSVSLEVERKRCFFGGNISIENKTERVKIAFKTSGLFEAEIHRIIHIPALRGNPERTYQVTAVGQEFPGVFDNYVASIITFWQSGEAPNGRENLDRLNYYLNLLQLTTNIEATQLDDTQVEIKVGRLPCTKSNGNQDRPQDMVSIADVGFGVSQTLPVLVALIMADPGQLVYIEQPEIHLHPKATVAIAQAFADAAKRGVKVVVETHSELFLTGVQALVAEDYLHSELVRLNWFTRRSDGTTKIDSANLDHLGRFGDWPEDFADTALSIQNRYLTAVEQKLWS
jgi:predicted ATPase